MQISTPLTVAGQQWIFPGSPPAWKESGDAPFSLEGPPGGALSASAIQLFGLILPESNGLDQMAGVSSIETTVAGFLVEPPGEVKDFSAGRASIRNY